MTKGTAGGKAERGLHGTANRVSASAGKWALNTGEFGSGGRNASPANLGVVEKKLRENVLI